MSSWRVLTALSIVITGLAVMGVRGLQQQITERAVASAVVGARSIELLVVSRNLTLQDIWLAADQRDEDAMDGDIILMRKKDIVFGLRVWALVDGHQVYGDPDHRDASVTLPATVTARARSGQPSALDAVDDATGQRALAVYLPDDANGDGTLDAVTEVLIPRTGVDGTVAHFSQWLYGGAGGTLGAVLVILYLIRRHQIRQEYAATHDPLTGLGNRVLLARTARGLSAKATTDAPVALLMIDLDGFKGVNDTLGHRAGDELLVVIADRLREVCRGKGHVSRLGGDEFAVLLPNLAGQEAGLAVARAVRSAIRRPVKVSGVAVEVDGSIGIAYVPDHVSDVGQLMRCADLAMYDAKQHGTGIVVFHPSEERQEDQHVTLVPELRRALAAGELELFYQPACAAGQPVGTVEALLRWRHPTRGLLPAEAFVPHAEKTSMIKELTAWVLRTAADQGARWQAAGRPLRISVNISARDLRDDGLVDRILEISAATGFPVGGLQVEVNESVLRNDTGGAMAGAIRALCAAGVHVAIDDVGLSYNAVFALSRLPLHEIKIHPRFVQGVSAHPSAAAVLLSMADATHGMGARCVAEGVESAEDWRLLIELGCDEIQGHVLTRPMSADEVGPWIDEWNTTRLAQPAVP